MNLKTCKLKLLLLLTSALILASCMAGRPLANTEADNNTSYNVQYLFEHDGCKVYRFYDRGNCVYFTNCNGSVTSIGTDSVATYTQTSVSKK